MDKRKRHEGDLSHLTDFSRSSKRRKPLSSGTKSTEKTMRSSIDQMVQTSGTSSKDAFKQAWINASDERRAELVQAKTNGNVQDDRPRKPKKHRKKRTHLEPSTEESGPTTDAMTGPFTAENYEDGTHPLELDISQLPEGLSRHQRRRWRRKLIKQDSLPESQRAESTSDPQLRTAPRPSAKKQNDVAWADKPIGRAAMARRLATTPLMPPPAKRWHGSDAGTKGATAAATNLSTPWQRSATANGKLVLQQSSVGAESDAKSVVTGIEQKRASSQHEPKQTSNLAVHLPHSTTPAKAKRSSFGNKVNSVPTHFVDGDAAENFRRFSALQDNSDDSSETSSESDDHEVPNNADESWNESANTQAQSGELDGLILFPEIMQGSSKLGYASVGVKRTIFGSEVDGGRSSTPAAGERDIDDSQEFVARGQSLAPIDEETSMNVLDEILRGEMKLTRELPAGKRAPIPPTDLEHEDGLLTQDSSDRRLTRSASKVKPAMLHKRIDSGIPVPASDVVIVRSMRLPDGEGPTLQVNPGERDTDDVEAEATTPTGSKAADAQCSLRDANRQSSSPLSELSQSPSPLQKRRADPASSINSPVQQAASEDDSVEDTIAVAVPEEVEEPKKKRKMTGRTSKHFSTPKTKAEKSRSVPATAENARSASPTHGSSEVLQEKTTKKRKRSSQTKDLLAETGKLIDDVAQTTDPVSVQPPKKRSRRSSGTLANLSNENVIESRSRRSKGHLGVDGQDLDAGSPEEATNGEVADEEDTTEDKPIPAQSQKRKRRSRRDSGNLANLVASNIIEGRQRRFKGGEAHEIEYVEATRPTEQEEGDVVATAEEEEGEIESRPKKRARRSGGKITDLDSSNILESRSRGPRHSSEAEFVPDEDPDEAEVELTERPSDKPPTKTRAKRKSTGKRSAYFIALDPLIDRVDHYNTTAGRKRAPAGVSTALVPSINTERFGIIQEKLWREPFWLLIATCFLNKTTGRAAAPKFWAVKEKYSTPEALAAADQKDIFEMVKSLGFQNQRSERIIAMAKAWVAEEPVVGRRWRKLHYPVKGDGKGFKKGVVVEEDADEVEGAIEIGHLPGAGVYACDSWRIFCRDVLRGVADDYNGKNAMAEGFVPEWQKVLAEDKELRACLRWMWLREGWIWDHSTGEKRKATDEEMERAVKGEMEVADAQERKFAVQAVTGSGAGVKAGLEDQKEVNGTGDDGEESELSDPPPSSLDEHEQAKQGKGQTIRGRKRAATPEQEDAGSSDNIVVSPPAKKRRTSGRAQVPRILDD